MPLNDVTNQLHHRHLSLAGGRCSKEHQDVVHDGASCGRSASGSSLVEKIESLMRSGLDWRQAAALLDEHCLDAARALQSLGKGAKTDRTARTFCGSSSATSHAHSKSSGGVELVLQEPPPISEESDAAQLRLCSLQRPRGNTHGEPAEFGHGPSCGGGWHALPDHIMRAVMEAAVVLEYNVTSALPTSCSKCLQALSPLSRAWRAEPSLTRLRTINALRGKQMLMLCSAHREEAHQFAHAFLQAAYQSQRSALSSLGQELAKLSRLRKTPNNQVAKALKLLCLLGGQPSGNVNQHHVIHGLVGRLEKYSITAKLHKHHASRPAHLIYILGQALPDDGPPESSVCKQIRTDLCSEYQVLRKIWYERACAVRANVTNTPVMFEIRQVLYKKRPLQDRNAPESLQPQRPIESAADANGLVSPTIQWLCAFAATRWALEFRQQLQN